jgi:signal transduction histidine kinase
LEIEDPERAHTIFRLVQEGLTNAMTHARATQVWIAIAPSDKGMEITVSDDGVGPGQFERGFGLNGLAERLAELGGKLDIKARPGGGFQLEADIPAEKSG